MLGRETKLSKAVAGISESKQESVGGSTSHWPRGFFPFPFGLGAVYIRLCESHKQEQQSVTRYGNGGMILDLAFQAKMALPHFKVAAFLALVFLLSSPPMAESGIGVNWGILSSHKLSPFTVVDLLQQNKIEKVKLFDADPDCLNALRGSGIQVMVGIPNELLSVLSSSTDACDLWVSQNVSRYLGKGGVDIRYVASHAFFC